MVRLRLDLAYDGADFAGWARQPGLRTVQGELESALGVALRLPTSPRVICAGRTDAGVHALGQVAHVDVPIGEACARPDLRRLLASLRGLLPRDIAARRIAVARDGFDARFAATSRLYSYSVSDAVTLPDPLLRGRVFHWRTALDIARINEAAIPLLGLHDFAAFCRARPGSTAIRRLLGLRASRVGDDLVRLEIEADAFCHGMVRSLMGALLPVGAGRKPVTWPAEVLSTRRRDAAPRALPARGLVLEHVRYPEANGYAGQVARARAVRQGCAALGTPQGDLL